MVRKAKEMTSAELAAQADELSAKAKQLRKEANAAKRREKREAEKRAAEQLARNEAAAFQYSKTMKINTPEGKSASVYEWVMESYLASAL